MKRAMIVCMLVLLVGTMLIWTTLPLMIELYLVQTRMPAAHAVSDHAQNLHKKLLIVDLHADSLLWNRNLLDRGSRGHVDIPRLIEGNVALQAFTIVTKVPWKAGVVPVTWLDDEISALALAQCWPQTTWGSLAERALYQADKLNDFAQRSEGKFRIIRTAADLQTYLQERSHNPACTAGFLGVEGAHALDGNLDNIDRFFDHGIRMMAPSHFFDNDIGGSGHGIKAYGLTDKGKEMVRRMEAKHMVLDLAHASPATIKDSLAMVTRPVVVSHTGVKGTFDSCRNLSDEEIIGIAKTGGVIGIGYFPQAVGSTDVKAIAKAIRYTAKLAGVEHVCLGSDFDGAVHTPFDTANLVQLTQALIDEGFTDEEIRLIMGANAIRVLRQTLPK